MESIQNERKKELKNQSDNFSNDENKIIKEILEVHEKTAHIVNPSRIDEIKEIIEGRIKK